jgi:signal transduction histidine kinase
MGEGDVGASAQVGLILRPFPGRAAVGRVGMIAAVALAYFTAAKFGFLLAFATKQVTAVWPPTGIAFVAYVLFGYRAAAGVFLGAFLANASSDEPVGTALGIAVGNTLPGFVGVFSIRRWVGPLDRSLERLRDVLGVVVLGAGLACTVSATNGVANLAIAGIVPWSSYASVWWVWWAGDAMGVLLVAPFLLTWVASPRLHWVGARRIELATLFGALAAVSYVAFSGHVVRTSPHSRFEYAVFPFIIWTAVRFGQREAASAVLLICGIAIRGVVHDEGPFATGPLDERLLLLEVFMATTAVTALTLGAVTAERRRAQKEVAQARDKLELRVEERTAELAATNSELAKKNEEVEAFVYIVSHDLRAPLVNLQGFSKELETSCRELREKLRVSAGSGDSAVQRILDDDIPGSLQYIRAGTVKFQRLIDALLTLSRYGRLEYRSDEIDVRALVAGTIESLHQSIEAGKAEVTVGPLPKAVGDMTAIGQVFSNLVGNALKYRRPGVPGRIEIGGKQEGAAVHYWVKDNGSGIPESAQRRLFQVFQRFHPDLAPGEGMGLAIVKRVIERHGGKVWAESTEGVGTTFHLELPGAVAREG